MNGLLSIFGSVFEISAEFFKTDGTGATYLLWGYMRTFANVLLIIILLVIVISQLTGFGIDNYGIKKMLPKLVIAAVLINLSFIICQLAVDISNILGSGLNNMLGSISDQIQQTLVANGADEDWLEIGFAGLLTGLFGASAGAAAVSGTVIAIVTSIGTATIWIWLVPIIIAVIIAFVAVMLFFFLLAAREILVMICAAISPLAFVCLILPNTHGLFKKWIDLGKGLLLIYPICGALHGLSKIVKIITFNAAGVHIFMVVVAMISTFIPFFLAPTLLKKSLGAIGAATAKLQSAGIRGLRRTQDVIMHSDIGKEATLMNRVQRATRRANSFDVAQRAVEGGTATRRQRRMVDSTRRINRNARDLALIDKYRSDNANRGALSAAGIGALMSEEDRNAIAAQKIYDDNIDAGLLTWKNNGITFDDGTTGSAENPDSFERRLTELRGRNLTDVEQREVAIAARGLLSIAGGGSTLAGFIRNNDANTASFNAALQKAYDQDSKVRSALGKKDTRANYFMEQKGLAGNQAYQDFYLDGTNASTADRRITTDEVGFTQSGVAFNEYMERRIINEESAREVLAGIEPNGYLRKAGVKQNDIKTIKEYIERMGFIPPSSSS